MAEGSIGAVELVLATVPVLATAAHHRPIAAHGTLSEDAGSAPGIGMTPDLALHLERVLAAPREHVFRMHAEPELLAQWWGPKGFTAPSVALDVRVGGNYRIAMQPPQGDRFFLSGEFREVDPPTLLVYTFRWEPPDPDDRETVVAVSLQHRGGSTVLTVDQQPFATEARRSLHEQGWSESLDRLEELIGTHGAP